MVAAILERFKDSFCLLESCCLYDDEAEGRSLAGRWSDAWIKQLNDNADLSIPEKEITSRSALVMRSTRPGARIDCPDPVTAERIDKIARGASVLCEEICRKRLEAGTKRLAHLRAQDRGQPCARKKDPHELEKKEPVSCPSPPPDSRPASITPSRIDPETLVGFQVRLREAWDCFRTDRLKEAEAAARALITDVERGASRTSTPQPRPQAELMRLRAARESC